MAAMNFYPQTFDQFVRESGRLRTRASIRSFRYPCAGLQAAHPSMPVGRFTPNHLTAFCLSGSPAPNTVKHRRSVLSTVFEWAEWAGVIDRNPASGLKFSVQPGHNRIREGSWLSETQVSDLIRACPDTFQGERDRILLMFGFLMGLRLAALSDLRWSQLSDDFSVLSVKVKGQKLTKKGVPGQLQARLADWRLEAPLSAVAVIPALDTSETPGRPTGVHWDRPLGRNGVSMAVHRAGRRIGVDITPHDMRRTLGALMETQGYSVPDIQRALDHSNVGTTSTYLDRNPDRTVQATKGISLAGIA